MHTHWSQKQMAASELEPWLKRCQHAVCEPHLQEMIRQSARSRCPLPLNRANKSVSEEGHYSAHQSSGALKRGGDGQRLVQCLRDRSLDVIQENKTIQWQYKSPKRERGQCGRCLFPSVTISKVPLKKSLRQKVVCNCKAGWSWKHICPACTVM